MQNANGGDYAKPEGHSFPLCCKLVETLQKRRENFHIKTLFILGHNTKLDAQANTCPIFNGCLVSLLSLLFPTFTLFFCCLRMLVITCINWFFTKKETEIDLPLSKFRR